MNVAIIGAGFAGLALAWYLSEAGCKVTLYDTGGGASTIASGLMHPYPGEQARRSKYADEGLAASLELLKVAEGKIGRPTFNSEGIVRYAIDEAQKEHLIKRTNDFSDIEQIGEGVFFIKSGYTVFSHSYLEGLRIGVTIKNEKVEDLNQLKDFDHVVLACGAGVLKFPQTAGLKLKLVKGQILKCKRPAELKNSIISKGYITIAEDPNICYVGATFEREFTDALPHLEAAKEEIFSKIAPFFPPIRDVEVLDCRAAMRVTSPESYLPIIKKLEDKLWLLSAFGSRGLLYHAFFAKQLKDLIVKSSV